MANNAGTESETTAQNPDELTGNLTAVNCPSNDDTTLESNAQGGTESTVNDNKNTENSLPAIIDDDDREKTLDFADELVERGSAAAKEGDFVEATDCYSRALEIRTEKYGELAPECVNLYYKYGCALLYKAQEEADPLGMVLKEAETRQDFDKDGSIKNGTKDEAYTASSSSKPQEDESTNEQVVGDHATIRKDQEEDEKDSDVDDPADADDDESDLDLAWKMLDVARAIVEKHSGDTMEKVDILSSLAEVALEREDVDTSLSDYLKALSVLERIVEPDNRYIAELNFRICLCLEIGSRVEEAISYCKKAISICSSRVERLKREIEDSVKARAAAATMEADQVDNQSSVASESEDAVSEKETEIKTLSDLSGDVQKKLEDLHLLISNPPSVLSEILDLFAAKTRGVAEKGTSSADVRSSSHKSVSEFGSSNISNAHSSGGASGVTDLGVVGRGVKRVNPTADFSPSKKPAFDATSDKGKATASDSGNLS